MCTIGKFTEVLEKSENSLGDRIKLYRNEKDFSKECVANFLRISCDAYGEIESGCRWISLREISLLCRLFGIGANELLLGTPDEAVIKSILLDLPDILDGTEREKTLDRMFRTDNPRNK
jgi:DNA-binding XRE family transcriptional regulator